MTAKTYKTFGDIIDGALEHASQPLNDENVLSGNSSLRDKLKRLCNARYLDICGRQKWKWLRTKRAIKIVKKYTTGTAAITNGSRGVTLTGATIDETFVERKIYFNNEQEVYEIIAVDSDAGTLILDTYYNGTTDTDATFVIYKDNYGLWPDFSEFDDVVSMYKNYPIRRIGPSRMNFLNDKYKKKEGSPLYVTVDGQSNYEGVKMGQLVMGQDFMGRGVSKKMRVWPSVASLDYILPITFIKEVVALEDDSDKPLMHIDDRIVLFYGTCADVYDILKDNESVALFEARYQNKLEQMTSDNQEDDDDLQFEFVSHYRQDEELPFLSAYYTGRSWDYD